MKLAIAMALLLISTTVTAQVVVDSCVFGGGNLAPVNGHTKVIINYATARVECDVYGGGALAEVGDGSNTTDTVILRSGHVNRNIYGGGLGDNDDAHLVAANVRSSVEVIINGGTVGGSVFGCNNLYGVPDSTVKVVVEGTNGSPTITGNVYGGGNLAAYTAPSSNMNYPVVNVNHGTVNNVFGGGLGAPAKVTGNPQVTVGDVSAGHESYEALINNDVYGGGDAADVEGATNVLVQKCNTIINGDVYGGGNAADIVKNGDVGGTASVTVTGGIITGEDHGMVFGGGHGDKDASPAVTANVEVSTSVTITGGIINKVFGGSNSAGTINGGNEGGISVLVNNTTNTCPLHIIELYGGGNFAASQVGNIDIRCTGTGDDDRIDYVYGGANQAQITGDIILNIVEGRIGNVFGGNNTSGLINGNITVNINKKNDACVWYVGNVYGGGNHADYDGTPNVNIINGLVSGNVYGGGNDITDGTKGVKNSNVEMTGGTVLGGVYGGCNLKGTVTENSVVKIYGGTVGSEEQLNASTIANVFGGGLGENTNVNGDVTVTISRASGDDAPAAPTIYGDVYGGSALGSVNSGSSDTTTVKILDGILKTRIYQETSSDGQTLYYYTGGNVFGGGLGETGNAEKGKVNGKVFVNIGMGTPDPTNPFTVLVPVNTLSGNATIEGNVYGCNNSGGSPQDDVTVNIFQTAHTDGTNGTPNNTVDGNAFAIANVFGGGNEADFTSANGKTYVNIYTCDNTIGRVFGGGNAAATPDVITHIQGGRFFQVFGGGNGERGVGHGADVNGDVRLNLHGGNIGEYYGGSNQNGTISGTIYTEVLNDSPCGMIVEDFFCGGNFVDIHGDLVTTIACSDGHFTNLYGGCNQATIYGNVILNLCGGTYTNVFGGSKGVAGGISADIVDNPDTTPKEGNITLNLYGGTIENAFGGSNINGNIEGVITVNVIDDEGDCPLYITNIYGGSNETDYTPVAPETERISPVVNVVHAKYGISGNVYGGSKGKEDAETPTAVNANPLVNIGYDATNMNQYLPSAYPTFIQNTLNDKPRAIVAGSVYGGGDAATVNGNTAIFLRNRAKVFGNVYGGGNKGKIIGNTNVIINGANQ